MSYFCGMGRCKDCVHWEWEEDFGSCARASSEDWLTPDDKDSLAFAAAQGEYEGVLMTRADFGCVQFEARDRDEAREQAISDLIEKIANLPGITPADLELLEEITGNAK